MRPFKRIRKRLGPLVLSYSNHCVQCRQYRSVVVNTSVALTGALTTSERGVLWYHTHTSGFRFGSDFENTSSDLSNNAPRLYGDVNFPGRHGRQRMRTSKHEVDGSSGIGRLVSEESQRRLILRILIAVGRLRSHNIRANSLGTYFP